VETSDPTVLHVTAGDGGGGFVAVVREEMARLPAEGWRPVWFRAQPEGPALDVDLMLYLCATGSAGAVFDPNAFRTGIGRYQRQYGDELAGGDRVDVAILHDPVCLPLASYARRRARTVAWRCHLGHADPTDAAAEAFEALSPHLADVDVIIFPDRSLVWPQLRSDGRVVIIQPGTDPDSAKNRPIGPDLAGSLWAALARDRPLSAGNRLVRCDESTFDPDAPFLLQVSRWDPIKGQAGVLAGFADLARALPDLELVLLGPRIAAQPREQGVWDGLAATRAALDPSIRRRVHLWRFDGHSRGVEDLLLNVAQRKADTVVQNSRRESFGLTVTEAMCKGAVVVGSDVEGIRLQISHDVNGLLTPYTEGGPAWVEAVHRAHTDPVGRHRWRQNAAATVRDRFTVAHAVRRQLEAFGVRDAVATP
jgi:trehalose synthase